MTKITLITGASRGLGRNTALSIARAGDDVIITYHSRSGEADAVVAEVQAMGRKAVALQLDCGNVSRFGDFARRMGAALQDRWDRNSFDHLVNNAGHGDFAMIADTTEAQFDALVNVHFKGIFFLTQTLLPLIADGGRIVNLSSGLTRVSAPGFAAYSAAKAGVHGFIRDVALELAAYGINVNAVAPGPIDTERAGPNLHHLNDTVDYSPNRMTPLGRLGQPIEVANAVLFLTSEEAAYITGHTLSVTGGR